MRRLAVTLGLIGSCTGCASSETPLGSIGAVLGRSADTGDVHVREVPGDAFTEGTLLPGDRIVSIDGVEVSTLDADALRRALRGPVGTKLRLTVLRGASVVRLELARVPLGTEPRPAPAAEQRLEE